MSILAFCEFQGSTLRTSALANLAFARASSAHGDVIALLIGPGAAAAAADATKYAPKVITVEDGALAHYLAETYAPVVARLAKENGATLVSATATAVGKDMIPRVAGEFTECEDVTHHSTFASSASFFTSVGISATI